MSGAALIRTFGVIGSHEERNSGGTSGAIGLFDDSMSTSLDSGSRVGGGGDGGMRGRFVRGGIKVLVALLEYQVPQ